MAYDPNAQIINSSVSDSIESDHPDSHSTVPGWDPSWSWLTNDMNLSRKHKKKSKKVKKKKRKKVESVSPEYTAQIWQNGYLTMKNEMLLFAFKMAIAIDRKSLDSDILDAGVKLIEGGHDY